MCEPPASFLRKAHVAYIPDQGRVVGLSKLVRVTDIVARRPQLQERLTSNVADIIMDELKPKGVVVVVEAEHLCMSIRGIKKPGAMTVTSAVRGLFRTNPSSRSEVLAPHQEGQPMSCGSRNMVRINRILNDEDTRLYLQKRSPGREPYLCRHDSTICWR